MSKTIVISVIDNEIGEEHGLEVVQLNGSDDALVEADRQLSIWAWVAALIQMDLEDVKIRAMEKQ